jgi:hypothetical protein
VSSNSSLSFDVGLDGPAVGFDPVTKRPLSKKSKKEASFHSSFLLGLSIDPENGGDISSETSVDF